MRKLGGCYLFYYLLLVALSVSPFLQAQEHPVYQSRWFSTSPAQRFRAEDTMEIMRILRSGEQNRYLPADTVKRMLLYVYTQSLKIGYVDGIAGALIELGNLANKTSNQAYAIQLYKRAIGYSRNAFFYHHFTAAAYSNIGSIYYLSGQYELAALYFDSSLKEGIRAGLPEERHHIVITYNNLSVVQAKIGRPEVAMNYLEQAEGMARRNHFRKELMMTLCSKGNVFSGMGRDTDAVASFREALLLAREYGDREMEQTANHGLGIIKLRQNHPEQALVYLEQVARDNPTHDPYYGDIMPRYYMGMAYFQLKQYDRAEQSLLYALQKAEDRGYFNDKLIAHQTLADIYEATGRYKETVAQLHMWAQQKDTLLNREKIKDINELEFRYRTLQKDRELALKDRDLTVARHESKEKNMLIAGALAAVFLLAIALWLTRYVQRNRIKQLRQQQELEMFKAVMAGEETERARLGRELHDGIGGYLSAIKISLATLRMRIRLFADDKVFVNAVALLDNANDELREIAHNLVPSSLAESGLGEAIYLLVNRWNQVVALEIDLDINGVEQRLNPAAELMIYRVVQEIVHNIIKHAEATQAMVSVSWQKDILLIAIDDNGKGIAAGDISKAGIGLPNLKKRVEAVNGTIEIESKPGEGTSVYLEFPLTPGKA